ncbi:MAG: carboxymuconolactone decarboxylase [Acidimicrobiales bacterium]|nr:carboxymuconolactone decarboxylase [Acidimicrobiales bacterium]
MTTDSPRIRPLPPEDREERTEALLAGLRAAPDEPDLNLFATLAHHPRLLKRWTAFGGLLLAGGTLPARDREVLILRTAANCGADYEWGHHLPIGRAAGLTDAEMADLATPMVATEHPRDALLVRAADELHEHARLSEVVWVALARTYDEQQLIELCMLVGQYHLVAFALNSLGVEREPGVEGLPR